MILGGLSELTPQIALDSGLTRRYHLAPVLRFLHSCYKAGESRRVFGHCGGIQGFACVDRKVPTDCHPALMRVLVFAAIVGVAALLR